jgi:hypothetical protein
MRSVYILFHPPEYYLESELLAPLFDPIGQDCLFPNIVRQEKQLTSTFCDIVCLSGCYKAERSLVKLASIVVKSNIEKMQRKI